MRLGGLIKNSFIDFPGKISCVAFVTGCNFSCPYCHNPELAMGKNPQPVNEEWFFEFLDQRKNFLDGVVISGGEPTLAKDLPAFIESIKKKGFTVKLDTNGSRPDRIADLLSGDLLDYIAMDVKTDPDLYAPHISNTPVSEVIQKSIRIIMNAGIPYEFRTTCVSPFINRQVMETIYRLIKGADLYALQKFSDTQILEPNFYKSQPALIPEERLERYREMGQAWVKKCIIR